MDKQNLLFAAIAGAVTGSLAWFALKPFVEHQMETAIRDQLRTQLPQQLSAQLDTKLASYGFTPQTGQQVASLIAAASRSGIL